MATVDGHGSRKEDYFPVPQRLNDPQTANYMFEVHLKWVHFTLVVRVISP